MVNPITKYTIRIPSITAATQFRFYRYAPASGSYLDFTRIAFLGVIVL
jgi:hypothetical protein